MWAVPLHNVCNLQALVAYVRKRDKRVQAYKVCIFVMWFINLLRISLIIYIIKGDMFVCLFVRLFRMAGQTAGPIETKLDTRTHVHPGSVSGKVNVKVIHVCLRE